VINRTFTKFAVWFGPFKHWFLVAAGAMLVMIAYQLLDNKATIDSTKYLPFYLVTLLWMLFFYTISSAFQISPTLEDKKQGFFGRLKQRIAKLFAFLMTIVFLVLFIASCHVSIRFISLIGN